MPRLRQDAIHVQNPALGAFLQWRYATGYFEARGDAQGSPLVLAFLVLPLLLHEETLELIAGTNKPSGLRGFAGKFGSSRFRKSDVLLGLHERTRAMRPLSLTSLRMGIAYRLVSIDKQRNLLPLSRTSPRTLVPTSVRSLVKNAEKLGAWSAELTLFEIASILKVGF
jgi:Family of unknown function (DUF6521)